MKKSNLERRHDMTARGSGTESMNKVYVVIEIYGHVTKILAVSQGNLGNGLNQATIPNDEYPKQLHAPSHLLDTDNTDEVFEPNLTNLVSAECELVSVDPRTTDRTVDELVEDPGDESPSEESPSAEPGEDPQTTEEDASEDDAVGRKNKQPVLKGKCTKIAAEAALAAAEAVTCARAEAREIAQAYKKGKGKGKRGPGVSTFSEAPVASTSTADPSTSAADASAYGASSDAGVGASAQAEDSTAEQPVVPKPRPRRNPLPYTFYNVHGKNIKLCSSDTVAMRFKGYREGVAVISQPLRRGHNFRFRVDKTCDEWLGTVTIGAVGVLPLETPSNGVHLEPPCWVLSSDLLNDNGTFFHSMMGMALDDLTEQSVLTIHFRFTSELILQVNGKLVGCIATVPRRFSHVFPTIDLYGRICQISVLLHPYVIASGASLDLPIITENREDSIEDNLSDDDAARDPESRAKKKTKAYSQDNLIEPHWEPLFMPAGPSYGLSFMPYRVPTPLPFRTPTPIPLPVMEPFGGPVANPFLPVKKKSKHKNKGKKQEIPPEAPLHQSLNLSDDTLPADNNEMVNRCIHKSHSTQNFSQTIDDGEAASSLRHTYSVGSRVGEDTADIVAREHFCDTNIRHNDRYPEANDVDNLDNEIMDALTMETGNLPDLTEEQSSSIDESTRRDDFWSESLSVEYLNYLNGILCLDQEGGEGTSLESEWEASGEGCEHLHLVLKYWNYLVLPYPELRQAVSWGQVRCYCSNCQPDAQPAFAGWVRIERIDGVGAAQRAFWHVVRSTLGAAQVAGAERGPARRPRSLSAWPCAAPPYADIWFDEEGKPHHTVLAIEIDVEGSDAENDRLLAFLIYLKPHVAFAEDNPPSLDE